MIKIEKIYPGTEAHFLRNGVRQPVFLHQLLTMEEHRTLKIARGQLMYSIDEQEVVTQQATTQPVQAVESTRKVLEPETTKLAEKPKIVYPSKKKTNG
jgi:hypothetical protein